jgi:hypothetical protein
MTSPLRRPGRCRTPSERQISEFSQNCKSQSRPVTQTSEERVRAAMSDRRRILASSERLAVPALTHAGIDRILGPENAEELGEDRSNHIAPELYRDKGFWDVQVHMWKALSRSCGNSRRGTPSRRTAPGTTSSSRSQWPHQDGPSPAWRSELASRLARVQRSATMFEWRVGGFSSAASVFSRSF